MNSSTKNILVSGASGIIGYGILRSLAESPVRLNLIGTTIYTDSPAEYFCDVFEKAAPTSDDGYIDWLLSIIAKHDIDLIIPGIEDDVYKWKDHLSEIKASGVEVLLNNTSLISLCKDKWAFYEYIKANDSPYAIETSLDPEYDSLYEKFGAPFLLKQRCGHGSKGIVIITDRDMFGAHESNIGKILMAQPLIGSGEEEYTVSAFCDGDGGFHAYVTLRRTLSKDGYTEMAEIADLDSAPQALEQLCALFKPVGPTNFQFRQHEDTLKLLEINPRISSATSIRTRFGYNESVMAVDYVLNNIEPKQPLLKRGKAVRYIEDAVRYE